ncbi:MAG TPA: NAD(P)H-dependent oxidoreductase [Ramlibacter sp.]|uniref:FMN-dependent NADH-azoreductase n=1 Tax=Ramlibacter sp. TaxID=1917967 RepID=UPI002BA04C19|nr:NAD(P)H-dependent oxidoreductase [Ramlibacter sp.]HVZ45749.1 NAD(P)H-dependent oxidoreductase [Ramlibacter sp.]
MNILHLDSSALGANSVSRSLTAKMVAQLLRVEPAADVSYRDLAAMAMPAVTEELLHAMRRFPNAAEVEIAPHLLPEVTLAQELIDQLLAADTVIIGAPMYNFSIPQPLKAWIDRVVMPGRTFRYTAEGPQGLAGGKRVIVVSTRGSRMSGSPYETALDHQEAYLLAVLGFIGIKDVKFVRAEGLGMSALRDEAIAGAEAQAQQLAGEMQLAAELT